MIVLRSIKYTNDRVASVPGISISFDGDLYIDYDYRLINIPATTIPIDTLVNTSLNIEDDEDEHKYTNGWYMMRLDDKIDNFAVNSTRPFVDVDLLEVFSEEE